MDEQIKQYFEEKVSRVKTPPFPGIKKKERKYDNPILSLCAAAAVLLFFLPSVQNSQIRNLSIPEESLVKMREEISQGVHYSITYLRKKGERNE